MVNAATYRKIKDNFLMACVHLVWLLGVQYNLKLTVLHIRGTCNQYADTLSRWDGYSNCDITEVKFFKKCIWVNPRCFDMVPNFDI